MSKYVIDNETLVSIGDAIREKAGTTDAMTPAEMVTAIAAITTGGSDDCNGRHIPDEALTITGECGYKFAYDGWTWFIDEVGDKITTTDILGAGYMFYNSTCKDIPFEINLRSGAGAGNMFNGAKNLETIKAINNFSPGGNMDAMFTNCNRLRYLPEFKNMNLSAMHANNYGNATGMFNGCWSLRSIPEDFLKEVYSNANGYYYSNFSNGFTNCYVLDELRGLRGSTNTMTSNMFSSTFNNCHRLKDIIFATQEDGSPYVHNWKSQVIDLASYSIGYYPMTSSEAGNAANFTVTRITEYNSGITGDKRVYNDETYEALKNDPDWFSVLASYSRYNHDSAVNTINSLPDTSAYLASAGGSNTIKFQGNCGAKTDGGAISNLTEEEIAVATAKGWTVALV